MRQCAPHAKLVNFYGSTETPQAMAFFELPDHLDPIDDASTVPLGEGIDGVRLLIEDGEIRIQTRYLTRGYLDPAATSERFTPSTEPEERIYRTGDQGVAGPSGIVKFAGRKDRQLKIRGFRVEPSEVESTLRSHPDVADVIVAAIDNQSLTAFVIPTRPVTAQQLRQAAADRLPSYAVPTTIVFLERFPLTPNGKIDQQALTRGAGFSLGAPSAPGLPSQKPEVQPKSLSALFSKILPTPPPSPHADFFDLGGDSLAAIQLLALIESEFGRRLSIADLTLARTPAKLEALLANDSPRPVPLLLPLNDRREGQPLFCVHPAFGNVIVFEKLAAHLDRPVYGLRSPGLDGSDPPSTIEAMAALYLREIRSVQPHGPYFLAGFSAGGAVAYEMARMLEREGVEATVIALDTTIDNATPLSALWLKLRDNLAEIGALDRTTFRPYLRTKWFNTAMNARAWFPSRDREGAEHPYRTPKQAWQHTALAFVQARKRYRPGLFSGRVLLLLAGDELPQRRRRTAAAWRAIVQGELIVHTVPGDHEHMLDPAHAPNSARLVGVHAFRTPSGAL